MDLTLFIYLHIMANLNTSLPKGNFSVNVFQCKYTVW